MLLARARLRANSHERRLFFKQNGRLIWSGLGLQSASLPRVMIITFGQAHMVDVVRAGAVALSPVYFRT